MGVGKSAVSRILLKSLPDCVWLDGDWCRNDDPFKVNEITKAVILDNICHCLNNFLSCGQYKNIVFSWVMHEQSIIDGISARLDLNGTRFISFSLVCSPQILRARLLGDIKNGLRSADVTDRALLRLECYAALATIKIDTTRLTARQAAEKIQTFI